MASLALALSLVLTQTPVGRPPAAPSTATAPAAPPAPPVATVEGPARPDLTPAAVLEELSGSVQGVDRKTQRLTVETAAGPVVLTLDRNTMVYTPAGLGTVLDLRPGAQVRAGRNASHLAYWVQVRPAPSAPSTPSSTPGQGTGPGGSGMAPAGESAGPGGGTGGPAGGTAPVGPSPGTSTGGAPGT